MGEGLRMLERHHFVNRNKRFAEYMICSCPSGLGYPGKKHRAIKGVFSTRVKDQL